MNPATTPPNETEPNRYLSPVGGALAPGVNVTVKLQLAPAAKFPVVPQGVAPAPAATTKSLFVADENAAVHVAGPNNWNVCAALDNVTAVGAVAEKLKNDGVM